MNYSPLLSSILKGRWAIDPRLVESNRLIIDKMLNRGFTSEEGKLLSEVTPYMYSTPEVDPEDEGPAMEGTSDQNLDDLPPESTIIITLNGTMLKYGTWCSYGTTEIAQALFVKGAHPNIGSVIIDIDSGGGAIDAIAPMVQVIERLKKMGKSVIALVDLCASAAYFVASYCHEIIASNDISAEVGSIGVMCSFRDYSKMNEMEGITEHVIYSGLSEYKNRPYELAKKGQYNEIRTEELDPLARRFQEAIRSNRGNKLNEETPGLLAGKTFFAGDAKQNGLIDQIGDKKLAVQRARDIRQQLIVNQYYNI